MREVYLQCKFIVVSMNAVSIFTCNCLTLSAWCGGETPFLINALVRLLVLVWSNGVALLVIPIAKIVRCLIKLECVVIRDGDYNLNAVSSDYIWCGLMFMLYPYLGLLFF